MTCRESGCRNDPVDRGRCDAHARLAVFEAKERRKARNRARNRELEMGAQILRLRRQLPALARHMATIGDITDLPAFMELITEMLEIRDTAVRRLHYEIGYSWAEIGAEVGVSKQAAHKRWSVNPGLTADRQRESA